MKPPAFQFYADDFLAGVADMTQAEVGAYILLLCHQWSRGEIPNDPQRTALIAKGEVPSHVAAKFPNGKNDRMEREREKQLSYRNRQAELGRKGGLATALATANAVGLAVGLAGATPQPPSPSPSPSPYSVTDSVSDTEAPSRRSRSIRPALEEWLKECQDKQPTWPAADATSAWEHYEKVGWKSGRTAIVKWEMCIGTCFRNWRDRRLGTAKPHRAVTAEFDKF